MHFDKLNTNGACYQRLPHAAAKLERDDTVEHYPTCVGLSNILHKKIGDISNIIHQPLYIAHAFASSPKTTAFNERFEMQDSLTHRELQEMLLETWK